MEKINLNKVYKVSEDVVAREIKGEMIIIPLVAGIADIDDELFALNESGKAIWKQLDGQKNLAEIAITLASEYKADRNVVEQDVVGLTRELFKRRMVIEVG